LKIITTHHNPTFDSIAGVFAASLLHRDAVIVLPKKLDHAQKNFISLHFSRSAYFYQDEIDSSCVTSAILICVKNHHRLQSFSKILDNPNIFVVVYDKSPAIKSEIRADSLIEAEYGSVTSLICEKLFDSGIKIEPLYATLFALGIHDVTGSLLYPNTSAADINCLAKLFKLGVNLKTIGSFLKDGLSDIQKNTLDDLVKSRQIINLNGFDINFYFAESQKFIYKFDNIVQRIVDSEKFNVAIFIAKMGLNVHVLARSNIEDVNLGEAFSSFDGGGPKYASYATFHNCEAPEVFLKIKTALKKNISPKLTARDIMSRQVLFLKSDVIAREAEKILFRYGYSAAPVVEGEKIIGFIRKADIDKTIHHGLSHAPISGFVCREVIYVHLNEPFDSVRDRIASSEAKAVLVGNASDVAGIINRTDILNRIFIKRTKNIRDEKIENSIFTKVPSTDLSGEKHFISLSDYFSRPIFRFLSKVSKKAAELKVSSYIVGGIVRDMILKKQSLDIDIVIEGMSAIDFAEELVESPEFIINRHERFKTAVVLIPGLPKIDFATARSEFYASPAALPDVFQSNLYQDLLRRDFTINAMAVSLGRDNFGELIDFYGGFEDIKKKKIRILHSLSFIEDPTRIFRALRFKTRLGFGFEKHTERKIREAIDYEVSKKIEPIRIYNELELILKEPSVCETIRELEKYSLFEFISRDVIFTDTLKKMALRASKYLLKLEKRFAGHHRPERTIIFLAILLLGMASDKIKTLLLDMHVMKSVREKILEASERLLIIQTEYLKIEDAGGVKLSDSNIYRLFNSRSDEFMIIFMAAMGNAHAYRAAVKYIFEISKIKPSVNGDMLKNMGLKPGPVFKIIIDKIAEKKAAGDLKNHADEIKYAKKLIESLD